MNWLWNFLRRGFVWAVENPLVLVLAMILIVYNKVFDEGAVFAHAHLDWTSAQSIWDVLWSVERSGLNPTVLSIGLLLLVAAAALTSFEVEGNFALFAKKPHPLLRGLRAIFSSAFVYYFVYQILLDIVFLGTFTLLVAFIVLVLGLTGLLGALLLFALVIVGYPTFVVFISTGAAIACAHVGFVEKMSMVRTACRAENSSKLFTFYFLRVGVETAILSAAVLLSSFLHLSLPHQILLVSFIAVIPFTIIRTGGYMLKFEVFKDHAWFKEYFAALYSGTD